MKFHKLIVISILVLSVFPVKSNIIFSETKTNNEVIGILYKAEKLKDSIKYKISGEVIRNTTGVGEIRAVIGRNSNLKDIMSIMGEYFLPEGAEVEIEKIGLCVVNGRIGLIMAAGEEYFGIDNKSRFEFIIDGDVKKLVKITMIGDSGTERDFYYSMKKVQGKWKIADEVDEHYIYSFDDKLLAIRSSSDLYEDGVLYDSSLLWDSDPKTSWVEGVAGDGIGEWVDFAFLQGETINSIELINGYAKSERIYQVNNRVKKLKVTLDNTTSFEVVLKDGEMSLQTIKLPEVREVERIRLTILEVYKGQKYRDTCISEVSFNGVI